MPERRLARWLERRWYGDAAPLPLLPLSWLYGGAVRLRCLAFQAGIRRSRQAGVPTVVIGNLTAGGTGETPLVLWLATELRRRGASPGIVLRGHGGTQRTAHLVSPDDDAARVGDEALLLARRAGCPVAVGVQRERAAKLLVQEGCDVVVADDGLQHLALARDLAVVVIDGARGFGNGALLPAGPLREPASRLAAADLVVLHGEDRRGVLPAGIVPVRMQLVATALRELGSDAEVPLRSLEGSAVHALAGIGNPERFIQLLRSLGASPEATLRPDHHVWRAGELPGPDGRRIVMTEKDAVKCRRLAAGRDDLYYLQVEAVLSPADAARFLDRVQALRRQ
jgi:tetraacyldisaccharide 4'-kinase